MWVPHFSLLLREVGARTRRTLGGAALQRCDARFHSNNMSFRPEPDPERSRGNGGAEETAVLPLRWFVWTGHSCPLPLTLICPTHAITEHLDRPWKSGASAPRPGMSNGGRSCIKVKAPRVTRGFPVTKRRPSISL